MSKSLLSGLLVKNPEKRLGGGREDAEEVKRHPFYASVNWQDVYDRKVSKVDGNNLSIALLLQYQLMPCSFI